MVVLDRVYGSIDVTEPLLVELIESPALQRLKGINQAGYVEPWRPGTSLSRFEHSVGVMHLLRSVGASLEEQAAGLVHDVSHGTFSHCLDYVLAESSAEQNVQDRLMDVFVREKTSIPSIVRKHGLSVEQILDDTRHPLKETSLPDLCADRIDYAFRDAVVCGACSLEELRRLRQTIERDGTRWVVACPDVARAFGELFRRINGTWWAGFPSAAMFLSVREYLRHALARAMISIDDLYVTDAEALAKINAHVAEDAALATCWKRMNDASGWKNDPSRTDAKIVCKSRMVDPLVRHEGQIGRLSAVQPDWGEIVRAESKPKEWYPVYLA